MFVGGRVPGTEWADRRGTPAGAHGVQRHLGHRNNRLAARGSSPRRPRGRVSEHPGGDAGGQKRKAARVGGAAERALSRSTALQRGERVRDHHEPSRGRRSQRAGMCAHKSNNDNDEFLHLRSNWFLQ